MEEQIRMLSGPECHGVRYFSTTVGGGSSQGDWASLNLGQHCADNPYHVQQNRARLNTLLPSQPHWLQQVHGTQVYRALRPAERVACLPYEQAPIADAAWTTTPNTVIAVLTADCLPIVIADTKGTIVGVVHAGWRGLAAGIIGSLFLRLQQHVDSNTCWQAWIGPAISQRYFEVGQEVYDVFVQKNPALASYFIPTLTPKKYLASLSGIAAFEISNITKNKTTINFSNACTYAEKNKYYSYRRQASTGRMATLAWLV